MEKTVEENLFNGEREAQIQAATELANLSSKQKHKLAERGVIVPLLSMLHSQNYEAIEAALFALLSLAFGSERLVYAVLDRSYYANSILNYISKAHFKYILL